MTYLQNRTRAWGFIQSEANPFRSRDRVVIKGGTGNLPVATILGKIAATGKYVPANKNATDGSQVAIAILGDDIDATGDDVIAAVIARNAEVRAGDLVYDPSIVTRDDKFIVWAALSSKDIIVRAVAADAP
jgi:hypothetical protein